MSGTKPFEKVSSFAQGCGGQGGKKLYRSPRSASFRDVIAPCRQQSVAEKVWLKTLVQLVRMVFLYIECQICLMFFEKMIAFFERHNAAWGVSQTNHGKAAGRNQIVFMRQKLDRPKV